MQEYLHCSSELEVVDKCSFWGEITHGNNSSWWIPWTSEIDLASPVETTIVKGVWFSASSLVEGFDADGWATLCFSRSILLFWLALAMAFTSFEWKSDISKGHSMFKLHKIWINWTKILGWHFSASSLPSPISSQPKFKNPATQSSSTNSSKKIHLLNYFQSKQTIQTQNTLRRLHYTSQLN